MKTEDGVNDLLERIAGDEAFAPVKAKLGELVDPRGFVGRAPEQVTEFLEEVIRPCLAGYEGIEAAAGGVRV